MTDAYFRILLVAVVLLELTALVRRISLNRNLESDGMGRSFGVTVHFQ